MFRGTIATISVLLGILFFGVLGGGYGCADADGEDPYALFETYEHADGLYRFRYLAPPWVFLENDETGERQLLAVDPDGDSNNFDIEEGFLEARMKMVVEMLEKDTVREAIEEDLDRWQERGAEIDGAETYESYNGDIGMRVDAVFRDRRLVSIYYAIANRRVSVMRVAAQESLDTYDAELLFKGFEPLATERDRRGR